MVFTTIIISVSLAIILALELREESKSSFRKEDLYDSQPNSLYSS